MTTNIFEAQDSVIEFARTNKLPNSQNWDGFYAGDGRQWIKCADHQAALESKLKFVFFVKGEKVTLYQA